MARKKTHSAKPHPVEWALGVASSLLVAILIAIVGYEAATNSGSPPDFVIFRLPPTDGIPKGQVRFKITNIADTTAAAVLVRGEWRRPDGTIETAETTLDYVPANSSSEGALIFSADPVAGDLSIRAAGYADP
ncbi:hypothetical protein SB748_24890 [Rhizobium sp. SIMBA_035]